MIPSLALQASKGAGYNRYEWHNRLAWIRFLSVQPPSRSTLDCALIETHELPRPLRLPCDMGISPRNLWLPRPPAGTISAGLVLLFALSSFAVAQEREAAAPAPEEIARPLARAHSAFAMVGTNTCSSVACHGSQQAELGRPRVREAYLNWMEFDPHARTRELLYSDKYAAILGRLEKGGHERTAMASRCAKCHDPSALPGDIAGTATYSGSGEGVGCESCHGNAEKWLTRHYEFGVTPQELLSLGKINTKSLPQRAAACAKCHVGSPDHDMNHDMIAAGHPALRFELAAYHDLIKFKHWHDGPERMAHKDFQVQLWAAGQQASAQARAELLADRADRAAKDKASSEIWTEFAEFNCFSCHQTLKPGQELVGPKSAGVPEWSRWNLAFADKTASLYQLPFLGNPVEVQTASSALRDAIATAGEPLDRLSLLTRLKFTLEQQDAATDWETRSQQYLALVAAERAYRDELLKASFRDPASAGQYERLLAEERDIIGRLENVRRSLKFESHPRKTVLIDEPLEFRQNQATLGNELLTIVADLLNKRTPPHHDLPR